MANRQLVWLVTGTSSGIGRELVLKILARGDKAIATARASSFAKLADLKAKGAYTYELDVTASEEDLQNFAKRVIEEHGHVDVIVHNAGFATRGVQEVCTRDDVFAQFNTNVFGPLNINRAFLPYMRSRKTGWILWIGSYTSWKAPIAISTYAATKNALRTLAVGLDKEISPFGLRSVCFDFGYFDTKILGPENLKNGGLHISEYDKVTEAGDEFLQGLRDNKLGDPAKASELIIDIVRGEGAAAGKTIPPAITIGNDAYKEIGAEVALAKQGLEDWKDLTCSTNRIQV